MNRVAGMTANPASAERALIADIAREVIREELVNVTAPADSYLSTQDAAELADVSTGTIRRWIREGKLPPHRAGRLVRVRRAELERMMTDSGHRRSAAKNAHESPEDRARRMFG
jgi:excisionase family DNA binding protein